MRAIDMAGFGGYRIHRQALERATARHNAGERSTSRWPMRWTESSHPPRCRSDGRVPELHAALGGTPVQRQSILQEAERKASASRSIWRPSTRHACGGNDILIARGRAPVAGQDGRLESLIPHEITQARTSMHMAWPISGTWAKSSRCAPAMH